LPTKYARGTRAWGECQRCGARELLHDLAFDGHIVNLRVCGRCWEPKHPQEYLQRVDDPVALWRPAPENILPPGAVVLSGELGSIILTWTESDDGEYQVNTYLIYRAVGGSEVFEPLATFAVTRDAFGAITSALTYTDEDVEAETDYAYYVVARPVKGPDSARSNIVEFTTPPDQPEAPVLAGTLNDDQEDSTVIRIAAEETGSFNGFSISLPAVFNPLGSIVSGTFGEMYGVNPSLEPWDILGGTNGLDFVIGIFDSNNGIAPDADVFKRVEFTDRNAVARALNTADATTSDTMADGQQPGGTEWTWTGVAAQLFENGIEYDIEFFYQVPGFHLDWSAPAGDIDNYLLQRSVNGGAFALLATVDAPTTEYFDAAVSQGNTYAYRVIAHPTAGADSDPSNTVTFSAPTAPVLTSDIDQGIPEIELTWTAATVSGTTIRWYVIERQQDGGGFAFYFFVDGATLSFLDSSISPGSTYDYRVYGVPFLGVASANSNVESETVIEPDSIFFCTMGGDESVSANDGTIFGAPSAVTPWTEHPVVAGRSFYDMASSGSTVMVGGSLGNGGEALYRSTDMENWTALDPWSGDVPVQCIAFGAGGVWVAGGGVGGGGGSTRLAWSDDDGDTWNDVASELTGGETPIACFYHANFVNLFFLATDARRIYTSPDGATWTQALAASGTYNFAAGAAIGEDDPSNIVMSFDGEHFRSIDSGTSFASTTTPFATVLPFGMHENNSMFVTVGRDTGDTPRIFTSTNGSAWTERTVPAGVTSLSSVVWTGSQWVAVGAKGAGFEDICVISSADGITWAESAADIYVAPPRRIIVV
jgi:hypothetical protein